MFKRILIANRGEIALRIVRCCREMGIETVAVYSTADEESLPVMLATHRVCIGPEKVKESYLNQEVILETARKMECDAIHPGYGFLSENAGFAGACEESGITFIGPAAKVIQSMGDKQTARTLMRKSGVPVVPGSVGMLGSLEEARKEAEKIGYPVLIKATAGGGGKGMRKVFKEEELEKAFFTAKTEAEAAFGNGEVYLEKLIVNPHHIEFQILADQHGNIVHLGERDCSIQRNNQKLLEETPSWILDEDLRNRMGAEAVRAARACGYTNAGTVEFVLDDEKNFYFIEMNTRIQVEHPVTELLTGVDLIKEQIRIAAGRKMELTQEKVSFKGHAMECRINAMSPGKVSFLHFPAGPGVRVDSHLYNGCEVSPHYDSMVAKIIVTGKTRLETIRRMRRALEELMIEGVETNTEFMHLVTFHPEFIRGKYDTSFWEKHSETIFRWNEEGMTSDDE
ncbi:MAG: acetyl-CoA carboxylase biotin carboxylase subunit [Lachnospiraceae bacterium]|nr:acetyl-CoA carboxylase biotin carboxylase subunit [Lachnospiraceae bacterium]